MTDAAQRTMLAAGMAALGMASIALGVAENSFRCSRSAGMCEATTGLPGFATTADIAVERIRSHGFVQSRSRNGLRGETVLIDERGAQWRVAEDAHDRARANYARIAAFLDGSGDRVDAVRPRSGYLVALGALLLLGSPLALRRSATAAPDTRKSRAAPPHARLWAIAAAAAAIGVAAALWFK